VSNGVKNSVDTNPLFFQLFTNILRQFLTKFLISPDLIKSKEKLNQNLKKLKKLCQISQKK